MHGITRIPFPSSTCDFVQPFKYSSTEKVDSARA